MLAAPWFITGLLISLSQQPRRGWIVATKYLASFITFLYRKVTKRIVSANGSARRNRHGSSSPYPSPWIQGEGTVARVCLLLIRDLGYGNGGIVMNLILMECVIVIISFVLLKVCDKLVCNKNAAVHWYSVLALLTSCKEFIAKGYCVYWCNGSCLLWRCIEFIDGCKFLTVTVYWNYCDSVCYLLL